MDQRADGSRAFHRIGQPDMQGKLPRFTNRAAENQQANRGGEGETTAEGLAGQ